MCLQHWQNCSGLWHPFWTCRFAHFLAQFFPGWTSQRDPAFKKRSTHGKKPVGPFFGSMTKTEMECGSLGTWKHGKSLCNKTTLNLSFDGLDLRIGNTDIYNILNNGQPGGQEAQTARLVGWDSKDFESLCEVSDTNYVTNDGTATETSMTSGKVPVSQWHILNDDADSDFLSWIWFRTVWFRLSLLMSVESSSRKPTMMGTKGLASPSFWIWWRALVRRRTKVTKVQSSANWCRWQKATQISLKCVSVAEGRRELFKRIFKKRLKWRRAQLADICGVFGVLFARLPKKGASSSSAIYLNQQHLVSKEMLEDVGVADVPEGQEVPDDMQVAIKLKLSLHRFSCVLPLSAVVVWYRAGHCWFKPVSRAWRGFEWAGGLCHCVCR